MLHPAATHFFCEYVNSPLIPGFRNESMDVASQLVALGLLHEAGPMSPNQNLIPLVYLLVVEALVSRCWVLTNMLKFLAGKPQGNAMMHSSDLAWANYWDLTCGNA